MSNLWTTLFTKVCHDGPALYSFVRTRVLGSGCQTPGHCCSWKPALVHINMGRVRASPRWLKLWFSTAQGADATSKVVQKLQEIFPSLPSNEQPYWGWSSNGSCGNDHGTDVTPEESCKWKCVIGFPRVSFSPPLSSQLWIIQAMLIKSMWTVWAVFFIKDLLKERIWLRCKLISSLVISWYPER